jgi:hypothetical protein
MKRTIDPGFASIGVSPVFLFALPLENRIKLEVCARQAHLNGLHAYTLAKYSITNFRCTTVASTTSVPHLKKRVFFDPKVKKLPERERLVLVPFKGIFIHEDLLGLEYPAC